MLKLTIALKLPIKTKKEKAFLAKVKEVHSLLSKQCSKEQVDMLLLMRRSKELCAVQLNQKVIEYLADVIDPLEKTTAEFYAGKEKCESLHQAYVKVMRGN